MLGYEMHWIDILSAVCWVATTFLLWILRRRVQALFKRKFGCPHRVVSLIVLVAPLLLLSLVLLGRNIAYTVPLSGAPEHPSTVQQREARWAQRLKSIGKPTVAEHIVDTQSAASRQSAAKLQNELNSAEAEIQRLQSELESITDPPSSPPSFSAVAPPVLDSTETETSEPMLSQVRKYKAAISSKSLASNGCAFKGPVPGFLGDCAIDCAPFNTLQEALDNCAIQPACSGVTQQSADSNLYELRAHSQASPSDVGEVSWTKGTMKQCHQEQKADKGTKVH